MADTLQEVVTFPDWGKMAFTEYAGKKWTEVLPDCDDGVRDLVASLVQYESTRRTSAKQVCWYRFYYSSSETDRHRPSSIVA